VPLDPLGRPGRLSGQPRAAGTEAKTSALVRATDLRGQMLRSTVGGRGNGWQHKVIDYDRNGPGIVGYYLDTVALLASLCPLVPAERSSDGRWTRSDDPVLNAIAAGYRTPLFEQHELVSSHVRAREGVGEAWIVWSADIGWHIVTVPNVTSVSGANGTIQWTDLYGITRKTPGEQVYKSWLPDPWQPWLPTSPVRRALPNVKRIHSALRSQTRAADSRMTANGLIAFPDENEMRPLRVDDQEQPLDGVDQIVADYIQLSQAAFTDDDSVAAHVPFPYIGPKAEVVELGRSIDERAMEMETAGVEGFARDVNFPAQLLTKGPGEANHWNEWILQEIQQKMGLAPKLMPVCADITTVYFRPMVARVRNQIGTWDKDPVRVRLEPDYSAIASKPDKAAGAIEAYRNGIIDRDECLDAIGYDDVMKLPQGLTEYEHWQIVTGRPGAPYIEVDGENRVIMPEPLEEPPMDDMGAFPPADDGMVDLEGAPDDGTGALPPLDAGPPPAALDAGQVQPGPPAPPPMLAAVDDPGSVERMIAELAQVDVALAGRLEAIANAAVLVVATEVSKAVIRAYPARHPDRARLRELPVDEVWAEADSSIRSQVDVGAIAVEALEPYREQLREEFDEAAAAIVEAHLIVAEEPEDNSIIPELFAAAAVAALLAGIVNAVKWWAATPAGFTAAGVGRVVGPRLVKVPTSAIIDAMLVASGAAVGADGLPVKGAGGTPLPRTGGEWKGGTGMATGHTPAAVIGDRILPDGVTLNLKWVHSLYGRPKEPFQPHVDLNGRVFRRIGDIPGGYFPKDHTGCRCGMTLTLLPPMTAPGTL
jgi:hypothetical protein